MPDRPEEDPILRRPRLVQTGSLRLCIRPVTPEDREALRQGIQALSQETTYRRFFVPSFSPTDQELRYLTTVDGIDHVALGVKDCSRDAPRGVGVGRYVRLPGEPQVAEAAVVVIDAYQGQGIGSLLLAALNMRAAASGLERFRSYVLRENAGVADMLRALGATEALVDGGVFQFDVPIYADPETLPGRSELKRLRWAWHTLENAEIGDCDTAEAA